MLLILSFTIFILFLVEFLLKRTPGYLAICKGKMPKSLPIIGTSGFLFKSREELFQFPRQCARELKQGYGIFNLGLAAYQLFKVAEVELLLSSTKHTNKNMTYDFLKPFMGDGLLCSAGAKWQQRRRILTPTFHFKILQKFLKIFKEESEKLVTNLKNDHQEIDGTSLQTIVPKFTLNTICETAMGVKLDTINDSDEYRLKIHDIGIKMVKRLTSPWLYTETVYALSGEKRSLTKLTSATQEFTRSVIEMRRQLYKNDQIEPEEYSSENIYEPTKRRYAMLDTLLSAEKSNLINEQGIREEVDTFMFEGYDTTSVGLTFSLFMLAHHQQIQQQVYEEISEVLATRNIRDLSMADFNDFKVLDRVIKESLRLYPPVPFIGRSLGEDLVINGLTLPKDFEVYVHIYDLHHDADLYEDPERFDPDRFLPENVEKRHPFAFIPFSAGPRNCIGQKFALLEIKTVLVNLVTSFKLEAVTKVEEVVFIADIVLRAKDPVRIKFIPRIV